MTQLAKIDGEGTLKQLIESDRFKLAVSSALPNHLRPDRFIRVALTALTRTPKLAQCEQASFFQSLLTLSQFGLEPDGRNAHLIPFENRNRGVTECQLIIDYKGLVDLAMRSGKVAYIHADKVCENDNFQYDKGAIKVHTVDFKKPRGAAYAYYAICRFKDETEKCEVMTKDDVEKIRQRSRAKNAGPWVTDFDEMAKKTVFRRLSKWLQLSPEYRDALAIDGDALEEDRFKAALPAIARPVFSEPVDDDTTPPANGAAEEEATRDKSRGGKKSPKLKVKKDKTAAPEPEPEKPNEAGPNAKEVFARLEKAGYTVTDLLLVGIKNEWIDTPAGYDGTPESLENVPLVSVGEEKLGVFLGDWETYEEELGKLRAANRSDS